MVQLVLFTLELDYGLFIVDECHVIDDHVLDLNGQVSLRVVLQRQHVTLCLIKATTVVLKLLTRIFVKISQLNRVSLGGSIVLHH